VLQMLAPQLLTTPGYMEEFGISLGL
jgi:hypothetical protein